MPWMTGHLRNGSSLPADGRLGVIFSSTCSPRSLLVVGTECVLLPVCCSHADCERSATHSHSEALLFPRPARAASRPAWLPSPAPRTPQTLTCSTASIWS